MMIKKILFIALVSMLLMSTTTAFAGSVTTLNTFSSGTPAVAAEVNENFSAVKNAVDDNDDRINAIIGEVIPSAVPIMWASTDTINTGVTVPEGSGSVETNIVEIIVPFDGYLIISGNIFINNGGLFADLFYLSPLVDGSIVLPYESAVAFEAQANSTAGEMISESYTVTIEITAGVHTVSQNVEAVNHNDTYFYNRNNMTILFMPSSQGTFMPAFTADPLVGIKSESANGID